MAPPKRDLSDSEEDLVSQTSSNNKRARVSSTLPGSSPPPLPPSQAAETETEEQPDDYKPMDEEEEEEEAVDDDEEERAATQKANERLRKKRGNRDGIVAQSGVIEQVELQNFMCHKFVTVPFGPQINFLVGNNGSGKSAVLTGITMALGGAAKNTNRAAKGSGFVREGANFALCSVRLRNRGTDAYQPAVYGQSITIERRIGKDSGSYKIKNHEGKTVDTKKATLDAILDHYNIQVENPMTVLTQDQSRQFLANSTAKDKYTFFLRGTQLAQLTEEYEVIRANMESMHEILNNKREVIPELKEAYRKAKERSTEAQAAVGQKDRVEALKSELAWSYVDEIESKVATAKTLVDNEARQGPKIEAEIVKYQAQKVEAEGSIADLEDALSEQQGAERDEELETLRAQIKEQSVKLKEFNTAERTTNATVVRMREQIGRYDTQIAAERVKMERDIDAERKPMLDRIEELQNERSKLGLEFARLRHEAEDAEEAVRAGSDELREAKERINGTQADSDTLRQRMGHLNQSKGNSLLAFGERVPALLQLINSNNQWIKKPLGPIGSFVKLKEPAFADTLESFFTQTLNAFIVETEQDKILLSKLQRQAGCTFGVPIIKQAYDQTFNCSSGEPDHSLLTVRRALQFSNKFVEAVVINALHIEKATLVQRRADGDVLMRNKPRNVESCFSADRFRLGGIDGGSQTQAMNPWKGVSRLNPDSTAAMASLTAELDECHRQLQQHQQKKNELDQHLTALHRTKQSAETRGRQVNGKINKINNELQTLNEKLNEEQPSNLAHIEDLKREAEAELASTVDQFRALTASKREASALVAPMVARKNELDEEANKITKLAGKLRAQLDAVVTRRLNANSAIGQLERRLETHRVKVADMQHQLEGFMPTLEERTEQAMVVCAERPHVQKKKSPNKLLQEIENFEKALKAREKKQGASIEEILAELAVRKRATEVALEQCRSLEGLTTVLATAYDERIERWTDFRDAIASRAKMQFGFHLSTRSFTGKLQFNHDKNLLNLRVQTDDIAAGTQGNRQKDAKSLSGGEKSFSTICLLLTMWEAVGCPVRCLDEFDVFMDAVNRRISMKMMIDTAKATDGTQFILISPLDMGGIKTGPEVRVIRLADPGRNQGTLNLGGN